MCYLSQPANDLLLLTVESAIDISNFVDGKSKDLTARRNLAKELDDFVREHILYNKLPMNTVIVYILNEAIKGIGKNLTNVSELPNEVAEIVKILKDPTAEKSKELKKALNFCLGLSRAIMAYRKEDFAYRFRF